MRRSNSASCWRNTLLCGLIPWLLEPGSSKVRVINKKIWKVWNIKVRVSLQEAQKKLSAFNFTSLLRFLHETVGSVSRFSLLARNSWDKCPCQQFLPLCWCVKGHPTCQPRWAEIIKTNKMLCLWEGVFKHTDMITHMRFLHWRSDPVQVSLVLCLKETADVWLMVQMDTTWPTYTNNRMHEAWWPAMD